MTAPTREGILVALLAALEVIETDTADTITIERNRNSPVEEMALPALVLFDGDEDAANPEARALGRGAVVQVSMQPEIWGFVKADKAGLGTAINALLDKVRKALWTDAGLRTAIGAANALTQVSLTTGLGRGKTAAGDFGLTISITYTFNPADL